MSLHDGSIGSRLETLEIGVLTQRGFGRGAPNGQLDDVERGPEGRRHFWSWLPPLRPVSPPPRSRAAAVERVGAAFPRPYPLSPHRRHSRPGRTRTCHLLRQVWIVQAILPVSRGHAEGTFHTMPRGALLPASPRPRDRRFDSAMTAKLRPTGSGERPTATNDENRMCAAQKAL